MLIETAQLPKPPTLLSSSSLLPLNPYFIPIFRTIPSFHCKHPAYQIKKLLSLSPTGISKAISILSGRLPKGEGWAVVASADVAGIWKGE